MNDKKSIHISDSNIETSHGFFGKEGGVSAGIYSSLNCGTFSGDDTAHINENRNIVLSAIGARDKRLVTLKQVHSNKCVAIDMNPYNMAYIEADAMVTDSTDIVIGVTTADCVPVLYQGRRDDGSMVIGAAHSGHAGALAGVNENTIDALCNMGVAKESIKACLGPCISKGSYEVEEGFKDRFLSEDSKSASYFAKSIEVDGKYLFDLQGYIERRLKDCGIGQISTKCCLDTYSNAEKYFSYRRSVHKSEKDYGRQLSVIVIS